MSCALCLSNRPQFIEVGSKLPFCNHICQKVFSLINAGEDDNDGKRKREEDDYYREPMAKFSFRDINLDNLEHAMLMFDLESLYRARQAEKIINAIFLHPGFKLRYYNAHKAEILQKLSTTLKNEDDWGEDLNFSDHDYEFTPWISDFLSIALQQGDRILSRCDLSYFIYVKNWDDVDELLPLLIGEISENEAAEMASFIILENNIELVKRFSNIFDMDTIVTNLYNIFYCQYEYFRHKIVAPKFKDMRFYLAPFCNREIINYFYARNMCYFTSEEVKLLSETNYVFIRQLRYFIPNDLNVISLILDKCPNFRSDLCLKMLKTSEFKSDEEAQKSIHAFQIVLEYGQPESEYLYFCKLLTKQIFHLQYNPSEGNGFVSLINYLIQKLSTEKQKSRKELLKIYSSYLLSNDSCFPTIKKETPLDRLKLIVMTRVKNIAQIMTHYQYQKFIASFPFNFFKN